MANNEVRNTIIWNSVIEIRNALDNLALVLEQQNRILQRILEALCAK